MAPPPASSRIRPLQGKACVIIFAKPPIPGRVKTRLLSVLVPAHAAQIHFACLRDVVRFVEKAPGITRGLWVAGSSAQAALLARQLKLGRGWLVGTQRGSDLGARLHNAFHALLGKGAKEVIVIGTDTPWMGTRTLTRALRALSQSDIVLGPTEDGGYYLVGVRRLIPQMFQGISWGSHRVLRQTLRALALQKVSVKLLPKGFDLDRPADLARLERSLSQIRPKAPALARALADIRKQTGNAKRG